jgi:hypothetical protein
MNIHTSSKLIPNPCRIFDNEYSRIGIFLKYLNRNYSFRINNIRTNRASLKVK